MTGILVQGNRTSGIGQTESGYLRITSFILLLVELTVLVLQLTYLAELGRRVAESVSSFIAFTPGEEQLMRDFIRLAVLLPIIFWVFVLLSVSYVVVRRAARMTNNIWLWIGCSTVLALVGVFTALAQGTIFID